MKTELKEKWEEVQLGEIGNFLRGPFGSSIKKSVCVKKEEGSYKLYEQGNVIRNDFKRGEYYIDEKKFRQLEKFEINSGDVLITCAGTLGKIAIVPEKIEKGIINSVLMRIRLDSTRVNSKYFTYFFRSSIIQNMISVHSQGVAIKNLFATKELRNFKVLLPSLPTQQKIVSILENVEKAKKVRMESDQLTHDFLNAVFLEIFGDPETNPKKWDVKTIKEVSQEIIDCPHSTPKYSVTNTPYPCIRTSELENGYIDWSSMKYLDETNHKERIKRLVPLEGDIIYGREGTFGEAIIIPKKITMSLGQRVMLFRPDRKLCTSEFFWSIIRSRFVYNQALKATNSSTVRHVNVKDIVNFKIICPPLTLQENYSNIVKKMDLLRETQKNSRNNIETLSNIIMQKAFKGELTC